MSEKRAKVEINWDENLEQKVEKNLMNGRKLVGIKQQSRVLVLADYIVLVLLVQLYILFKAQPVFGWG